jgi:hypothetical protein
LVGVISPAGGCGELHRRNKILSAQRCRKP